MEKIKLVAESLQEWDQTKGSEELNESRKDELKNFLKEPKGKSALDQFNAAYNLSDDAKKILAKVDLEKKVEWAKASWQLMEKDPKLGAPKLKLYKTAEGKWKCDGAGAVALGKSDVGKELGQ